MKIIFTPASDWSAQLVCPRCTAIFEADENDLQYSQWKTSGHWFDGSAVTEMRFTVDCPVCDKGVARVSDESIPVLIQDRMKRESRVQDR